MSEGGLCLVGTPLQKRNQIVDTPDLAYRDFVTWGEDVDTGWARYYVDHSLHEVHDWLGALGVAFDKLRWPAGNSVPRFHETKGRGLGLVGPVYRECLSQPRIDFVWNHEVTRLVLADGHAVGAEQLAQPRPGYWHFEKVHAAVLQRDRICLECHAELAPSATSPHQINRFAQPATCVFCHGTP
jgi:succinate dehydrogenase/fumarate reductase flavoprotein subunit